MITKNRTNRVLQIKKLRPQYHNTKRQLRHMVGILRENCLYIWKNYTVTIGKNEYNNNRYYY